MSNYPELTDEKARTKWAEIEDQLKSFKSEDCDWESGKVPGYTYKAGPDVDYVIREAYQLFFGENALGKNAYKSVTKMETAVVEFCLQLFNHGIPPTTVRALSHPLGRLVSTRLAAKDGF